MRWPQLNMAAGPVEVSPRTLRDMARPVMYHYDPGLHRALRPRQRSPEAGLPHQYDVVIMQGEAHARAGSGRGQPDPRRATRCSISSPASSASGSRTSSSEYGGETIEVAVPYNEAIDPEDVRKALNANPGVKYLSVVHSETPSGTLNPIQEIGKIAHEFGVLTMVDTVSGLGSEMLSPEEWGMDIAIAGTQKCLSGPPGLALLSIIPAAWEAMETTPKPLAGQLPLDPRLENDLAGAAQRSRTRRSSPRCTRSSRS